MISVQKIGLIINLAVQSFSDNSLDDEINNLEHHNTPTSLDNPITISEVKLCIRKLRNNKACGEDLIVGKIFRNFPACDVILYFLIYAKTFF